MISFDMMWLILEPCICTDIKRIDLSLGPFSPCFIPARPCSFTCRNTERGLPFAVQERILGMVLGAAAGSAGALYVQRAIWHSTAVTAEAIAHGRLPPATIPPVSIDCTVVGEVPYTNDEWQLKKWRSMTNGNVWMTRATL